MRWNISALVKVLGTMSLVALLASCGSEDEQAGSTAQEQGSRTVSGIAAKGPLLGATIELYAFDTNGFPSSTPIASTTTDGNGDWSVSVGADSGPLLIVSKGGSFVDESDTEPDINKKRTIELDASDELLGVLFPGEDTATISLLTHALIEKSRAEVTAGDFAQVLQSNRELAVASVGFDPFMITSADPLAPAAGASGEAVQYAMYLGGVANALNSASIALGKPVPDYAIMQAFIEDITDGKLDGKLNGSPVEVQVNGVTKVLPDNIDLNLAIKRFLNNNYLAYRDFVPQVQPPVVDEVQLATPLANLPPFAGSDSGIFTAENTSVTTPNVLANDSDPDGDPISITSFDDTVTASGGTVTNNGNGTFDFTPDDGFTGNYVFSYTISDSNGKTDNANVTITVIPAVGGGGTLNNAPTANAGDDQNVDELSLVNLSGAASDDSDGSIATYAWSQLSGPTVGLINPTTATPSFFAPDIDGTDAVVLQLTVVDNGGLSDTDSVTININDIVGNTPPVTDAGVDQVVNELTTVNLAGSATDDGTITTYAWSQLSGPTVSINAPANPVTSFTAPDVTGPTVIVLQLTATDNGLLSDSDVVSITINDLTANIPPVANAGADQPGALEQTSINLTDAGSTDPDGTVVSYSWTQISGPSVTINNADTADADFTSPTVLIGNIEVLVFQLSVTDNQGGVGTDFVSVVVTPVNTPPLADAGADQTVDELTTVNLDAGGSSDADGSVVGYSWNQVSGPSVTLDNATVANPSFDAPDIPTDTALVFELTVTDNEGTDSVNTDTNSVTINLTSLNAAPVTVDDGPLIGTEDTDLTIATSTLLSNDTDPETDPFSFNTYTQPANGTLTEPVAGVLTYTPYQDFNGADSFTYTAIDDSGAISVSATVDITIDPVNDDPVANPDTASTTQGFPVTIIDLLDNDTDIENNTIFLSGVDVPANGVAVDNGDGTITYTPNLDFNGVETFDYFIVDSLGGNAIGTIEVTVVADSDGDGIIDAYETNTGSYSSPTDTGTDPNNADTDSDGYYDGHELAAGTSPLVGLDTPPGTIVSLANANNLIAGDITWDLAGAPYYVQGGNVTIQNAATLTIDPGVVVKFETNASYLIDVDTGGTLNVMGNAPVPQQVIMTSDRDDSINGDTNGDGITTSPAANNWGGVYYDINSAGMINNAVIRYTNRSLYARNASPGIRNLEVGDCGSTCIYHYATNNNTMNVNLEGIKVVDYDGGNGSGNIGIHVEASGTSLVGLNISNVDIADTVNGYGMHIESWGGNITGLVDNVTITDSTYTGLYIQSYWTATSSITATFSNIDIVNPSQRGIWITEANNGAFNAVKFDGSNSVTTSVNNYAAIEVDGASPEFLVTGSMIINGGEYGLELINAAAGDYNNIDIDGIDGITVAGIKLGDASIPDVFNNVSLIDMPAPFELIGQALPAVVTNGTSIDPSVDTRLLRLSGTMPSDTILGADPLGAGSVWYLPSDLTVDSGATLTVTDGAIIKMAKSTDIFVNAGATLHVDAGGGSPAVFTSIHDDAAGGDSNGNGSATLPAKDDWDNIQPQTGSIIDITNAVIRYGLRAIETDNDEPASFSMTDVTITDMFWTGIVLDSDAGGVTWTLNNVTVDGLNGDNWGVYVSAEGSTVATLDFNNVTVINNGSNSIDSGMALNASGSGTITGTVSNLTATNSYCYGLHIIDNSTGIVNPVISGLNITNSINCSNVGVEGDSTTIPTFNGSVGVNSLSASGARNLVIRGAGGNYSHISMDNPATTDASIHFTDSANPSSWDSSTIVLNNSSSPYDLGGQDLPLSVGTLGISSPDRGYTVGANVDQRYVWISETLSEDMTLVPGPLGADTTYLTRTDVTITSGNTLTMGDNTVLKLAAGHKVTVNDGGTLLVNATVGNEAVFTSVNDDLYGGDTLGDGPSNGARGDWDRISYNNNSTIDIDHAILRYATYAIVGNQGGGSQPLLFSITNSQFSDYLWDAMYLETSASAATLTLDNITIDGGSGARYGIYIRSLTSAALTLDFNNITMNDVSNSTSEAGLYIYTTGTSTTTGTVSNLAINSPGGRGIYIDDRSAGLFDVVFSGIAISDSGASGVRIDGSDSTQPVFDNSVAANSITNAGDFGIRLNGSSGSYSHIDIDNTTNEALYFENGAAPGFWDGSTITLSNVTEPIGLENMGLPPGIGYTPLAFVVDDYITISGILGADVTLGPDPLGTASGDGKPTDPSVSYWYLDTSLFVPNGITLNVSANTLVKGASGRSIEVQSGGTLNVNGTPGNEVYMTSFTDDVVGDPVASGASPNNWYGIYFRAGANGGSISSLQTWYGYYGIYHENLAQDINVQDLTINYALYGLYFTNAFDDTPSFHNTVITQTARSSIYVSGTSDATFNPLFSGTQVISSGSASSYDCVYLNTTSTAYVLSGWLIEGNCGGGVYILRNGTIVNNTIRNTVGPGIQINTPDAITVGGNLILNNIYSGSGGGMLIERIGQASIVENNIIRGNTANYGGGMHIDTTIAGYIDFTLRNNLIVENIATISIGGIDVNRNVTMQMENNTIADNISLGGSSTVAGFLVDDDNNAVTYANNIFSNNRIADDSVANLIDTSTLTVDSFNLDSNNNIDGLDGPNSQIDTDPQHTNGWYLTAGTSPAIDAGSDLPVNLGLTGTTTNIDGTLDGLAGGASDTVDLGYHFTSGVPDVDATNSLVSPATTTVAFSEVVTITITPRDGSDNDIGVGARVEVSAANFPDELSRVYDQGDGTYTFTYTAGTTDQDDTLTITVNGVQLSTQPFVDW